MKHSAQNPIFKHSNWRPYAKNSRLNTQQGLTLIELMVALVLGLVLVGGVLNVFVANREAYRSTENLTRIQENARTGFDFMARDLREAGQIPCGTPLVANVIRDASGNIPWWADWNKGTIIGVDGGQNRTDIVAFGTTALKRVAGTDAVLVIRTEQNEKTIDDHTTVSTLITLTDTSKLVEKDIVLACDLKSAAIFQVYDSSASGKVIDHKVDVTDMNCSDLLGYPTPQVCPTTPPATAPPIKQFKGSASPPAALVSKLLASFWYVGYTTNGQRSLYRTELMNKKISGVQTIIIEREEIVRGVQNLQLEYLTSNGATLAANWVDASDGTTFPGATATVTGNWQSDQANKVVAVRLNMTLQSEENIGTNQQPIQRQLIHVVALRNRDYLF